MAIDSGRKWGYTRSTMSFDCIVPAAGASRRMGSWKPLMPWGEGCIVGTVVDRARAAGATRIIVVAGFRGAEIEELFRGADRVEVVRNEAWERGMLGSIQRALARVGSPAFFVTPGDMPLVRSEDYLKVAGAAGLSGEATGSLALPWFPSFGGELGHPVLIPAALAPEILGLDPGQSLRPFLLDRGARTVEMATDAVLADLDSAEDYARLAPRRPERDGKAS